jgi:hypothetical protein
MLVAGATIGREGRLDRKSKLSVALALPCLIAVTGTCYADIVSTFNVSSTVANGTLAGTVTIDESNPALSTAFITAPGTGTGPFTTLVTVPSPQE